MRSNLVCGVGVYTKGKCKAYENGRRTRTYHAWTSMLQRCYSSKYQAKWPTYIGCTVCDEWLEFQAFAEWYEVNRPDNDLSYQLDKDLKFIGNKVYSPKTCLFVSQAVNKFTTDSGATRGEYMIGASWRKQRKKFQSCCCNPFTKKQEFLGSFNSELDAHLAWRKRKSELAYELAVTQDKLEVRDAILRWKDALDKNLIHTI